MNFVHKHYREMIALEPRFEPLETPIEDPVKDTSNYYSMWTIKEVDNA
jgi:hypothetical protein